MGAAEVGVAEVGVAVVRRAVVSRVSKAYLLWVYYLVLGILCLLVLGDGVVRVRCEQMEGDARPASARAPWWGKDSGGGGGGPSITPLTSATILSVSPCYTLILASYRAAAWRWRARPARPPATPYASPGRSASPVRGRGRVRDGVMITGRSAAASRVLC